MPGITVTPIQKDDVGLSELIVADIQMGDLYPTGGEPIAVSDFGFRVGNQVNSADLSPAGGYVFGLSVVGGQAFIKAFEEQGNSGKLKEVDDGEDLSAVTIRATVVGR